jgi:membrane protease YdiL (CAAX protease family)
MQRIAAEPSVTRWTTAPAGPAPWVAWGVVTVVSAVPSIVWVMLGRPVPPWLAAAQIAVTLVLLVAAVAWPPLRPLWRFAVVMGALLMLLQFLQLLDLEWMPLQALFGSTPFDARMQAEQTAKLAVTGLMILLLMALGYRRRDIFLTRGDLLAPIRPVPALGFPKPDTWRRFGLVWGFGIAGALTLTQFVVVRPQADDLAAIVPMIPAIVFYAAVNAFNEEMTFRAPMLASLEPAVGSAHALWQSAFLFGVAHYFGVPGGPLGAVLSIFMGWILGKAMLETRGLLWPWFIHFLSDVSIFTFIAIALVA